MCGELGEQGREYLRSERASGECVWKRGERSVRGSRGGGIGGRLRKVEERKGRHVAAEKQGVVNT